MSNSPTITKISALCERAYNVWLTRHARFAIKYMPSDYILALNRVGIEFISQSQYGDKYTATYFFNHRPKVSFSFNLKNPSETFRAVIGSKVIVLSPRLKRKILSLLEWEQRRFSSEYNLETTGNWILC